VAAFFIMLALCLVASAFMPSPTPALSPVVGRMATPVMEVDRFAVTENTKTGATAALGGTVAAAPVKAATMIASKALTAQVAFSTYALAAQLMLFGVVYRYVVRTDGNDMVKQGVVGMFAMCRALASTTVTASTSYPDAWLQIGAYFGESALAFAAGAAAIEYAWDKGWVRPLWYLDQAGYEVDAGFDRGFDRRFDRRGPGAFDRRGGFDGRVMPTGRDLGRDPRALGRDIYGRQIRR